MSIFLKKLQRTNRKSQKYSITIAPRELILDFFNNNKAEKKFPKQVVIAFTHR